MQQCIHDHFFNHRAELLLPCATAAAATAAEGEPLLSSEAFWRVSGPLTALLSPDFLLPHLRGGSLLALAATALDGGGSLALTPRGDLLIVCSARLYESLGLAGLGSAHGVRGERYCVRLRCLDPAFAPGGKACAKLVRRCSRSTVRLREGRSQCVSCSRRASQSGSATRRCC